MSNYVGKTECLQCGREVDVSLNRAGMAYYRCAPCGVFVQQKSERGNRMLLGKTRRFADPDEAPEPEKSAAPEPRESREITEPKPAPAPAPKPAKRGGLGFFSGT
jgi:DNA-directed RNA polymerase subunit RPC12/RpoP